MKIVPSTNFVSPARVMFSPTSSVGRRVRRELDAVEVGAEDVRGRAAEQRLRGAGRAFEQDVAARHRGDEQELDGAALADDDLADLRLRALAKLGQAHIRMGDGGHAGRPPLLDADSTIVGRSARLLNPSCGSLCGQREDRSLRRCAA